MDELSYQPPLRMAILRLVLAKEVPVTVVALAAAAQVPEDRARAYLSVLLGGHAVRVVPLGYDTGIRWRDWSTRICRSRPHRSKQTAVGTMDAMRQTLARNVIRLREAKEWSAYRLATEAGVLPCLIHRLEKRNKPPPFPAVIMISRALGVSSEDLVR